MSGDFELPEARLIRNHVLSDSAVTLAVERQTHDEVLRMDWILRNPGPNEFHGTLRLQFALPAAMDRPWFLVPGFFYGENRRLNQLAGKSYPRFDPAAAEPADMTARAWDFAADRTAAPLVFAHQDGRCLAVAAAPHYEASPGVAADDPEPQVGVGFGHDGAQGYIRFSLPACEEPFTYSNSPRNAPTIHRLRLPGGASVRGTVYIYAFDGPRHGYQRVLEDYWRRLGPAHPAADLPEINPLVADALHGIRAHYHEEGNYFIYSRPYDPVVEQIANARGVSLEWHEMLTGFVGGFMVCHSLLEGARITGDDAPAAIACRVADRICREGLSPSGFFWADFKPATVRTPNGEFPNPLVRPGRNAWGSGWLSQPTQVHSRTIADACDHLAAMIGMARDGAAPNTAVALWEGALLSNVTAALDLQQANGTYGQYYDAVTRRVVKPDGCGGLPWICAVLKAARLGLGGPAFAARLVDSARRAGAGYAPYVEDENIWGAPEDNDSPTSEDGMNAVMAYADLYARTDEARWLELARRAADWMLTFRKTYNQILPPASLLGRYGLRSRGGDFASASNNHIHVFEALCTRHLCDLSRWTGSDYYRLRALEHWAYVCQHLSRCDGMYNGFRGAAGEQFYWCNYGSWGRWRPPAHHVQKGNIAPMSAIWCGAVIPLAAADALREFS